MARSREFDEGEVLDAAVRCFWSRGYEGTSVRDLSTEMGIAGASLYNAFGDKQSLYRRALSRYVEQGLGMRARVLELSNSPAEALRAFFADVIARSVGDRERKGCMLVNAALEVRPESRQIRREVSRGLAEIEVFFRHCVAAGLASGVIGAQHSLDDLARHLLATLIGIRVLARIHPERELLEGVLKPALALLDGPAPNLKETAMTDAPDYTPPKIWTWNKESGGRFAAINRPIAGATHDEELPVGRHPLQLYSLATPNGVKVTILLEELLALDHKGAEYDAWLIRIGEGDQFGSGFVAVNPNSKIPALMDRSTSTPVRVFESGAILLYLAEKFGAFVPPEAAARAECLSWLFWQMGSAPYLGGGFGHFYAYAPTKIEYAIDRFAMEVKRQLDVLDRRLAESRYVAGDTYTIADMAIWPWYGGLAKGWQYGAAEFLNVESYKNVQRWADEIGERPAVRRGRMVNRVTGEPSGQVRERHDAQDWDTKTEDKTPSSSS